MRIVFLVPLLLAADFAAASKDLAALPPELQIQTRYLSLAHLPEQEIESTWDVLDFQVNSLSVNPLVVKVRKVTDSLGVVVLSDYGWKPETWEKVFADEPYFTVQIEKRRPYGYYTRRGWVTTEHRVIRQPVSTLDPVLVGLTGSQFPMVRGDYFLSRTAVGPGYYEFLGIKDAKTFQKLIGFDAEVLKRYPKELREAVAKSVVTQEPRRIERFGTVGGGYWRTSDVKLGKARDKKNALRVLDGAFEPDAHEEFAPLPNGLLVWGLFSAAGARQNTAPDDIASDSTAPGTDRRVHVMLSCTRCHGQHDGIQPVNGWARSLFQGQLKLQGPDYQALQELQRLYFANLERPLEQDRRDYARAVDDCNGLTVKENSRRFAAVWNRYMEEEVDVKRAAEELYCTEAELLTALKRQTTIDVPLSVFLRGGRLPRTAWEEAYPLAKSALRTK